MVEKIVRTSFGCRLCGTEYGTSEEASACENGGIAEPIFEVGEQFVETHLLPGLFIGWFRGDKRVRPADEIPIHTLVGVALARSTASASRPELSHRLVYILAEDEVGELESEGAFGLKGSWWIRLSAKDSKPKLVECMLRGIWDEPETKALAEQAADYILARARALKRAAARPA